MAQSTNSVLLHNLRGQIGKQLVVKQYGKKTVVTKYPDMNGVKPSKQQKLKRNDFADAVVYAQSILHDPVKKKAYARKLKKGKSVYHAAITEWMGKVKGNRQRGKRQRGNEAGRQREKAGVSREA